MALQKALVPVDIVAGLDTKTDAKLTAKLTDLQNGRYTIGSQISKRLGYTSMSQDIAGSSSQLTTGDGLTSFQDELLEFSGSKLYSYSNGITKWVDRGSYLSLKVNATDVVRNTSEVRNQDSCIASGLILYAWEQYDSTGSLEGVYASVVDQTSGAVLQSETLIDSTAVNPRCVGIGPNPTLVYVDTSSSPNVAKAIQVDIDSPTQFKSANTLVSDVKASAPFIDVDQYSTDPTTGSAVFAYNNNASTSIGIGFITNDGLAGGPGNGFTGVTVVSSCDATNGIAVHSDNVNTADALTDRVYVGYYSTGSLQGLVLKRFNPVLSVEDTEVIQATSTQIDGCSLLMRQDGDLQITYTLNATNTYDHKIRTAVYDPASNAVTSAAADLKLSVGLASKMFEYSSKIYMIAVHETDLQPTYFVMDTTGLIIAKMLPGTAGGLPNKTLMPSVVSGSSGLFEFGGLVRTRLVSKNNDLFSLAGISRMELDFTSVERFEAAELGENLHVGGGFVSIYDSQEIVEMNFHLYPENISAAVNNSTGSIAAGTYQYKVIWFWTDARGQIHKSTPSVAVSATTTGGSSTVTLTIPTLRLTQKTGVIAEVYRTTDTGTLFYKVGSVANSTSADSVSFADAGAISDTNLVAKESLYTDGGILDNSAPPASLVIAPYKNRLICVSSENPKKLLFSKARLPKNPVEFTDTFSITLNKAQRVTALAEFDQKLIIFEPNQIFYITGNGPTSTGAQNDFSQPNLVTGDVGCQNTNSLVLMPLGLMFQSKKGIYLLNRSLETIYIGADVEAYNDLTITSAELIEDENQIRYLTSDGRALIYDYFYGKWSTWTNHQGNGATIWNATGDYVYLRTDGRIFQQSATSYKDGDDPIEMSITTSWMKTNQVQGFQRIRAAYVLGDFRSDHTLKMEVGHNYTDYFNEQHTFDYISDLGVQEYGDSSPYGSEGFYGSSDGVADGVYQFRAHMGKQKCQAIRFRISDIEEVDPGQAYSISSLMLEVGIRNNGMKLPQQKLV
jgi:hypothetical protein